MVRPLGVNMPAFRVPASYVTLRYYGVHAFRWIAEDGSSRYVRYTWVPSEGDRRLGPREARARGRDFLQQELRERLERGPARFTLELQIAEPVCAQVSQTYPWRQILAHQFARSSGEEHLPAVCDRQQPRDTVQGRAEIIAIAEFRRPVMQGNTYAQRQRGGGDGGGLKRAERLLNRERGITVLLVTHEPEIARHTNRIVHIRDGRISSDEVVDEPVNASDILAMLPPEEDEIPSQGEAR